MLTMSKRKRSPVAPELGRLLAEWREAQGISSYDVEVRGDEKGVKIRASTWNQIERGATAPLPSTLVKISRITGISVDDLHAAAGYGTVSASSNDRIARLARLASVSPSHARAVERIETLSPAAIDLMLAYLDGLGDR